MNPPFKVPRLCDLSVLLSRLKLRGGTLDEPPYPPQETFFLRRPTSLPVLCHRRLISCEAERTGFE